MSFATNKLLLLCFCVFTFSSVSQSQFKTYTKNDGLTSSSIIFTYVDSKGVVWVATNLGLNAFTGKEWTPIKSITDSQGEKQNLGKVTKIFETQSGHLWVATEKGLFYYNRKYWTHFSDKKNNIFFIKEIYEDSKNRIWVMLEKRNNLKDIGNVGFSIAEGKLQMFNGSQWFDFPGLIGGSAAVGVGEPKDYFTSFIEDTDGNIWISSLDGLYIYDNQTWTEFNGEVLSSDKCYKVLQTSDNEIWVATSFGVAKQDGEEWIKYEKNKGIKDNIAYDLFEGNENRLWAFTRKDQKFKALCYYEDDKWKSYFSKDIHLKGEIKLINLNDELLAFSPKGIAVFNGKQWKSLSSIYSKEISEVKVFTPGNNNCIWFASQNEILQLTKTELKSFFSFDKKMKITSIFESSKNELWVGTDKSGVYKINQTNTQHLTISNGLNDNHIFEIFEDKRNNIWVVTRNGISKLL